MTAYMKRNVPATEIRKDDRIMWEGRYAQVYNAYTHPGGEVMIGFQRWGTIAVPADRRFDRLRLKLKDEGEGRPEYENYHSVRMSGYSQNPPLIRDYIAYMVSGMNLQGES